MDPSPQAPHLLAPGSQTVCYLPRLKVSVAPDYVRTFPRLPKRGTKFDRLVPWWSRIVFDRPGRWSTREGP